MVVVTVKNKRRTRRERAVYNCGVYEKSGVYEYYAARYNFP